VLIFTYLWHHGGGSGIYMRRRVGDSSDEMKPPVWLVRCASYVLVT
jgi:hypothetical protein